MVLDDDTAKLQRRIPCETLLRVSDVFFFIHEVAIFAETRAEWQENAQSSELMISADLIKTIQ